MPRESREPEALSQALAAALGVSAEKLDSEEAAELYRMALRCCWERMELIVGSMGAQAIVNHAIRVSAARCPQLTLASVGEDGVDLSRLEAAMPRGRSSELCQSLRLLCDSIFQTLSELTGDILVGPLLDEMKGRHARR